MSAIYIAAAWGSRQRRLQDIVPPLQAAGHEVTSRWLFTPEGEVIDAFPADGCFADIDRSDVVAIFTDEPSSTGGYHVELGYALAKGKSIVVVGPVTNAFHELPSVTHYATHKDFLSSLNTHSAA